MLCSGTAQNGGLSFQVFCQLQLSEVLGMERSFLLPCGSAFSWEGSQESWRQVAARLLFIILLSPGQPCHSPSTMSFKDSRNGQSRTSLSPSHCQRRSRTVEPAHCAKEKNMSHF